MTLTKKDLDTRWATMFRSCKHPEAAKREALERFSEEPGEENEWSEQDIYEQMRKLVRKYE